MNRTSPPTGKGLIALKIAALAAAGMLGGLALANRISDLGMGEPPVTLNGQQGIYTWKLGKIAYTVKGHREPLVLVHGIYAGASSYEFHRVFDSLAREFRVYSLDLLGFGRSARPAVTYTPAIFEELIEDFVRQVAGAADQPVSIMASSLAAAFTIRVAARRPGLISRLILIEPTGIENLANEYESLGRRFGRAVVRSPLLGQGIYNLLCSRPSIRYFLRTQTYADRQMASDDVIDLYYTMSHQPGGRFAIASFISGSLNTSVAAQYPQLQQPILLCWGKDAPLTPLENARAFRRGNPRAELRIFDCGGIPQDEVPDEFIDEVRAWARADSTFVRH
jgi:pimeloyl-ACP methyl ester carboxylesterase